MEVQTDFRDLLALFNKHDVEYLIVGGYAMAFHGVPRFTGDIDLFVHPEFSNARRILDEFGFGSIGLTVEDFSRPHKVIQLGVPPVRVDLLTSISGVSWGQAFESSASGDYGDITVLFIGREQFVANKRARGRNKDLADLEALRACYGSNRLSGDLDFTGGGWF